MTNQFTQTGLRTFNWKQLFTQPWWWLPLRSSKHQSPLLKTVLLRTTLPWTIKLHYYMSLLGSNHLLYCKYYSPLKNSSCLKFKVDLKMCKNCLFAIKVDFNFYFSDSATLIISYGHKKNFSSPVCPVSVLMSVAGIAISSSLRICYLDQFGPITYDRRLYMFFSFIICFLRSVLLQQIHLRLVSFVTIYVLPIFL